MARLLAFGLLALLLAGCSAPVPAADNDPSARATPSGAPPATTVPATAPPAPTSTPPAPMLQLTGKGAIEDDHSKKYAVEAVASLTYADLAIELGGATLPRAECGSDVRPSWTYCAGARELSPEDPVNVGDVIIVQPAADARDLLLVVIDARDGTVLVETRLR